MDNQSLNTFLELILDDYSEEVSDIYTEFYIDIPNEKLRKILAIYHKKFNSLFEYLNSRLGSGHFTAHESRKLIHLIRNYNGFIRRLKEYNIEIIIDKEYFDIISECKNFLQEYMGSPIPKNFKYIYIIYHKPLFSLRQSCYKSVENLRYSLKNIGEGSYANVFKYKDKNYNKYFAIKRAKKNLTVEEYNRFRREFDIIKKLNSPYIIEVYKFDEENKEYIMEYMDLTLEKYILQNNNRLKFTDRVIIAKQVMKAFYYIHSNGILHRDVSSKNVLIKKYDDVVVVKISDFGLVKLPESNLTKKNTEIKGYFNDFKSLERVGFNNYNIKHEMYSITKLIYFIMTGKSNLKDYDKTEFKEFVDKGTIDNLDERYNNIIELKKFFQEVVEKILENNRNKHI